MIKGDEGKTYLETCQISMMKTFQPLLTIFEKTRSSHRRCSVRKGVLRNFAKFTGNCARVSFFNRVEAEACNFIKQETLAQVFSCEFCEISNNTFFAEHLRATASDNKPW